MTVETWGIHEWGEAYLGLPAMVLTLRPWKAVPEYPVLFEYGLTTWSRNKRKPMDVEATVKKAHEMIVGLYTAHTKEEVDRFDYMEDDMLGAIFAAPVKQLREFYPLLATALESDPRVPLFVWQPYRNLADVVTGSKDDEVIQLKIELAESIAQMAEQDIAPQIKLALVNALKWRSGETLEKVDRALKEGKKPRLTGRSSCLFLEVGEDAEAVKVML